MNKKLFITIWSAFKIAIIIYLFCIYTEATVIVSIGNYVASVMINLVLSCQVIEIYDDWLKGVNNV